MPGADIKLLFFLYHKVTPDDNNFYLKSFPTIIPQLGMVFFLFFGCPANLKTL